MPIIRQNKNDRFLNRILIALAVPLVGAALWLIVFHNYNVALERTLVKAKEELKKTEAQNSQLNDAIFALLDSANLEQFAAQRGLVKEQRPQYLEVSSWELASEY